MNTRLWKGLIVIGIGAAIWVSPAPAGLKPQAWQLFAIFAATISGLILQPLPMGVTCFVSITFTALVGILTPAQVLSGFGNLTIWLIVSAFFIFAWLYQDRTGTSNRLHNHEGHWPSHDQPGVCPGHQRLDYQPGHAICYGAQRRNHISNSQKPGSGF